MVGSAMEDLPLTLHLQGVQRSCSYKPLKQTCRQHIVASAATSRLCGVPHSWLGDVLKSATKNAVPLQQTVSTLQVNEQGQRNSKTTRYASQNLR